MPFPFNALHFDLHCRLRELVTPGEAYALQIAAPEYAGLQPLQSAIYMDNTPISDAQMSIGEDNKLKVKLSPEHTIKDDELYLFNGRFIIINFTSNHDAQLIFDQFLLGDVYHIFFIDCELTTKFLQDFSKQQTTTVERLTITNCKFAANVTFELISSTFHELKHLQFGNGCQLIQNSPNWIDDLLAADFTHLEMLEFHNVGFDILNVCENKLVNFLKLRNEKFHLKLNLGATDELAETESLLKTLFSKQNFIRLWGSEENAERSIRVIFDWPKSSSCYSHQQCYEYKLR